MAELDYFPFYHSYGAKLRTLSDSELGRLVRALVTYSASGEREQLNGREEMAFQFITFDIDRAKANYEAKSESRKESARKRWDANASKSTDCNANDANASNCIESNNKSKSNNKSNNITPLPPTGGEEKPKSKRFIPPTVDEVAAYCRERGNGIDPEEFVDHYSASQWMRGKTKITDWKACVRTWEKNSGRAASKYPVKEKPPQGCSGLGDAEIDAIRKLMQEDT